MVLRVCGVRPLIPRLRRLAFSRFLSPNSDTRCVLTSSETINSAY